MPPSDTGPNDADPQGSEAKGEATDDAVTSAGSPQKKDMNTSRSGQSASKAEKANKTAPTATKRYRLRALILKITAGLIIFVPLFFAVSALGSRVGLWDWRFGFGTLTRNIGPNLLIVLLASGVVSLVASVLIRPRKGYFLGGLALVLALGGAGFAKSVTVKAQNLPLIHDISTDTQDPPVFSAAVLAERAKTEGVNGVDRSQKTDPRSKTRLSVAQVKAYPDVRTLVLQDDPAVIFTKAVETARSLGWRVVSEDADQGIIEATDTTFWFGFNDDIVIRIRPGDGGGSIMDIRSVSRVGLSDVGKNAGRIRAFSKQF